MGKNNQDILKVLNGFSQPVSLYIHIPFCRSKCEYCDFFSKVESRDSVKREFVDVLIHQMTVMLDSLKNNTYRSVYIGGGTPDAVGIQELDRILEFITRRIPRKRIEWTVELNPASLCPELIGMLTDFPVTRLSVGVQTVSDSLLAFIGRRSSSKEITVNLERLFSEWGRDISLDFISGIPGQRDRDIDADLNLVREYRPGHVSLYELTVEPHTPFALRTAMHHVQKDGHLWSRFSRSLAVLGYSRYEVSNFARPGNECMHNISYWRMQPYIGFGPSAVSTLPIGTGAVRLTNPPDIDGFLHDSVGILDTEIIGPRDFLFEHFMMGLRMTDGLKLDSLQKRFGNDAQRFAKMLPEKLVGLLVSEKGCLKTTISGMHQLNTLLVKIYGMIDEFFPSNYDMACNIPTEDPKSGE